MPIALGWPILLASALAITFCGGAASGEQATVVHSVPFSGLIDVTGDAQTGQIVAMQRTALTCISAEGLRPLDSHFAPQGYFTAASMRPGKSQVAVAVSTGEIEILSVPSFSPVISAGLDLQGDRVTGLLWSPDARYLAALTNSGGILVLDESLTTLATYDRDFAGPAFWVHIGDGDALLWGQDDYQLWGAYPNGTHFVMPNPWGNSGPWIMWGNGDVIFQETTPFAGDFLTSYRDFGRFYVGRTSLLDREQDRLVYDSPAHRMASWGAGTTRITLWDADLLPFAEVVSENVPPRIVKWIDTSMLLFWTDWAQGALYLVSITAGSSMLKVEVADPAANSTLSGVVDLVGALHPEGGSGILMIRFDWDSWYTQPAVDAWRVEVDTRAVSDGPHRLYIGFSDGGSYATWMTLNIGVQNGIQSPPLPPLSWFATPANHATVSGSVEVLLGVYDPNAQGALPSQLAVEFSVDGHVWDNIPFHDGWRATTDTSIHSDGPHRFLARITVAGIIASTAWVDVVIENGGSTGWIVNIVDPRSGSSVNETTLVTGTWIGNPRGTPWLELTLGGAAWIFASELQLENRTWQFVLPAGSPWPIWKLCVRLVDPFAVSPENCAVFYSVPNRDDEPPTVSNLEARLSLEQRLVMVAGIAKDDRQVRAVFARIDGGPWVRATGLERWVADLIVEQTKLANHTIEAVVSDGFRLSKIETTYVTTKGMDAPVVTNSSPLGEAEQGLLVAAAVAVISMAGYAIRRHR